MTNGANYLATISQHMDRTRIKTEAQRIEEDALHSAKGHFEAASSWGRTHYWIGIPGAILAAIAGAAALKEFPYHSEVAGVLSIVVAVLGGVGVFLNPQQKAAIHQRAGTEYKALQNRTRIFYDVELQTMDDVQSVAELKRLSETRDELNRKAPGIDRTSFEKARKGIEEGEAKYSVDKI